MIRGHNIREIRTARGIALRAVGKAVGLSVGYLHDVENGRRNISEKNLSAIAAFLGVMVIQVEDECEKCLGSGKRWKPSLFEM